MTLLHSLTLSYTRKRCSRSPFLTRPPRAKSDLLSDPHMEVVEIGVAPVRLPAILAAVRVASEYSDGVKRVRLPMLIAHTCGSPQAGKTSVSYPTRQYVQKREGRWVGLGRGWKKKTMRVQRVRRAGEMTGKKWRETERKRKNGKTKGDGRNKERRQKKMELGAKKRWAIKQNKKKSTIINTKIRLHSHCRSNHFFIHIWEEG